MALPPHYKNLGLSTVQEIEGNKPVTVLITVQYTMTVLNQSWIGFNKRKKGKTAFYLPEDKK